MKNKTNETLRRMKANTQNCKDGSFKPIRYDIKYERDTSNKTYYGLFKSPFQRTI